MIKFIGYFFLFCALAPIAIFVLPIYLVYEYFIKDSSNKTNNNNNVYQNNTVISNEKKEAVSNLAETVKEIKPYYSELFDNVYDGNSFELFCAELLEANNFKNVIVTPATNDFGVDILANTKDGVKYAFQCKFYSSSLGNSPVQEVIAGISYYKCHVGVVITNSTFTKNAIDLADKNGVLLWDKNKLNELINVANKFGKRK